MGKSEGERREKEKGEGGEEGISGEGGKVEEERGMEGGLESKYVLLGTSLPGSQKL